MTFNIVSYIVLLYFTYLWFDVIGGQYPSFTTNRVIGIIEFGICVVTTAIAFAGETIFFSLNVRQTSEGAIKSILTTNLHGLPMFIIIIFALSVYLFQLYQEFHSHKYSSIENSNWIAALLSISISFFLSLIATILTIWTTVMTPKEYWTPVALIPPMTNFLFTGFITYYLLKWTTKLFLKKPIQQQQQFDY